MKIAIVSDTHGLLRPELFRALDGVEAILHAGDLGPAHLLEELEAVAPVAGVWGNTDGFDVRARLPEVAEVEWGGRRIVVLHGHQLGTPGPANLAARYPDADLVVYGHTHLPRIEEVVVEGGASGRVLTVNPGSAGPTRGSLRPTIALAEIGPEGIRVELVELA